MWMGTSNKTFISGGCQAPRGRTRQGSPHKASQSSPALCGRLTRQSASSCIVTHEMKAIILVTAVMSCPCCFPSKRRRTRTSRARFPCDLLMNVNLLHIKRETPGYEGLKIAALGIGCVGCGVVQNANSA